MVIMAVVMFGLVCIGAIVFGGIVLHHLLNRKEKQATMDSIRTMVIPELEKMTLDMMEKSIDMVPDKMVDMTKKLLKAQKEFEDEDY